MFVLSRSRRLIRWSFICISLSACSSTTSESKVLSTDSRDSDLDHRPRYAGGEWSRNKILDYLSKYELELASEGNYEYVVDQCRGAIEPLGKAEFSFIEPTVIAHEWDDFRLDKYKEKYPQFKFGMGIAGNAGEQNGSIPRWNVNVYEIDMDWDGVLDTVLYGEAIEIGTYEGRGSSAGSPSGYLVFTPGRDKIRGGYLSNDPSEEFTGLSLPIFSALIEINHVYAVISVEDFEINGYQMFRLELVMVGMQDFSRGTSGGSFQCHYIFKSK